MALKAFFCPTGDRKTKLSTSCFSDLPKRLRDAESQYQSHRSMVSSLASSTLYNSKGLRLSVIAIHKSCGSTYVEAVDENGNIGENWIPTAPSRSLGLMISPRASVNKFPCISFQIRIWCSFHAMLTCWRSSLAANSSWRVLSNAASCEITGCSPRWWAHHLLSDFVSFGEIPEAFGN